MVKNLFFIFAILFISQIQMVAQTTLSAGPMVGVNFSNIRGIDQTEYKPGLNLGGFLNYSINEHLGLNAKLLFSQLGANFEGNDNSVRFNYIQLPVSIAWFFGQLGDSFRPKLYIGPYLGYLLKATDHDGNEILDGNSDSPFKSLDIGGQVGAGVNLLLGTKTWLNIDAALGSSLTNMLTDSDDSYKNLAYSINVGVSFPIGEE